MTRPESREIDEAAIRIFKASTTLDWEIRPQDPDYRIDYTVELYERQEPTGLFFNVQLKGTKSPKCVDGGKYVSFPMQVAHLTYYENKVPQPVFLVLVDVERETVRWLFLQRYTLQTVQGKKWRQQKTLSVRIPVDNILDKTESEKREIESAVEFMQDLHPGSPEAAVKAKQSRLEALDHRVNVRVTATSEETAIQLDPKEAINFTISAKGESGVKRLAAAIESGKKIDFEPGELSIAGSPLFEEHGNELSAVHIERKHPATLRLIASIGSSNENRSLDLPGEIVGGSKSAELRTSLVDGPLSVSFPLGGAQSDSPLAVSFAVEKWQGKDVRWLPHIEPIVELFRAINTEDYRTGKRVVEAEVYIKGNRAVCGEMSKDFVLLLLGYVPAVFALDKARYIAAETGVTAVVPNDFGPKHAVEIEEIYALLTTGNHRVSEPDASLTIGVSPDGARQLLEIAGTHPDGFPLSVPDNRPRPFLGKNIDLGELRMELTKLLFATDREQLARDLYERGNEKLKVVLKTTPTCECVVSRLESGQSDEENSDGEHGKD